MRVGAFERMPRRQHDDQQLYTAAAHKRWCRSQPRGLRERDAHVETNSNADSHSDADADCYAETQTLAVRAA